MNDVLSHPPTHPIPQELVAEAYEKQITRVQTDHDQKEAEDDAQRKKEWEAALALKQRFAPMRSFAASFEGLVNKARQADFEAHVKHMRADYERTLAGKIARARKKKADKEEREAKRNKEMEAIRRYEEERLKQAREERERYNAEVAARYVFFLFIFHPPSCAAAPSNRMLFLYPSTHPPTYPPKKQPRGSGWDAGGGG